MALRPTEMSLVYAALLIQAMFHIPQVRRQLASWGSSFGDALAKPSNDPGEQLLVCAQNYSKNWTERTAYLIVEFFTNMDLAILSEMSIDDLSKALFITSSSSNIPQSPGDLSAGTTF
jgi:hypothetical protein